MGEDNFELMINVLKGSEELTEEQRENCFFYNADVLNRDDSFPYVSYLEVTDRWDNIYIDLFKDNNIKGLSLNNSSSDEENLGVEIFEKIPVINLLMLKYYSLDTDFQKLHGFSSLKELEVLHLTESLPRDSIDYSFFNKLRECELYSGSQEGSVGLDQGNKTIFSCLDLEKLSIHEYKDNDFSGFETLTRLKYLSLTAKKLKNINGIDKLYHLEELELINTKKIEDYSEIGNIQSLRSVTLYGTRGKNMIETLSCLTNIESIILENCGNIQTIQILQNCKKLKILCIYGSTNILDGDLNFLFDMPSLELVAIEPKKHYSHKSEEILFKRV